jgi:uncharacterized integral membrane protein
MTYYEDPEFRADHPHRTTAHDAAVVLRTIVIVAIVVALVLVGLDNTEHVRIGYVVGEQQAPVWIVLIAAALAGALIGWLASHRSRRS